MKKKKWLIISIIAAVLIIGGIATFIIFTNRDKNTTLTILEKQWVAANKNKLVDLEIMTDVPNFNYNGEGVFFDFLKAFEENVGIEFNRVALKKNSENTYAFKMVDKAGENDIFIYQDNYVLVSKIDKRLSDMSQLENIVVGVLEENLEDVQNHLRNVKNIQYKTYSDEDSLVSSITGDGEKEVTVILLLRNHDLDIITKNDLFINYSIGDYTKDYVLSLGDNDKLNDILRKYYKKWESENYEKSYATAFSNSYFVFNGIAERERVAFVSKRYSYGFVEEAPFNLLIDSSLNGINASMLREFAKIAGIEISFYDFSNRDNLIEKFNSDKLDFIFNDYATDNYALDAYNTVSIYDERIVCISDVNNNIVVNSIAALKPYTIKVVKNTKISKYLTDNGINVDEYDNLQNLLNSMNKNSIALINKYSYNYYMHSDLKNFKVDYEELMPYDYNFTIKDSSENEIFEDFFNFYLAFSNEKAKLSSSYSELLATKSIRKFIFQIATYVLAFIGLCTLIRKFFGLLLIKKIRKNNLSKEHKLKYVDMLTSLKNRNYLNDNIEKWDASEVYPQTIIVIDLNNVAYINDNYGHQEGDSLIKEAANILIKTQISNTEIIRTNGNEFVVYMVGYDEKQVLSYIKKLNREFKDLAHGFGAAIGYSIINDAIKTIDDAVNEATLDMRNNKEEIQN